MRNLAELEQALTAGAESLLLDNMSPAETKKAVGIVRARGLTIPLEASGGDHAREYSQICACRSRLHFGRRADAVRGSGGAEHAGDDGYFLGAVRR